MRLAGFLGLGAIPPEPEWGAMLGTHESIVTLNAGKGGRRAAHARKDLAPYLKKYANLDKIIMFLGVNVKASKDLEKAAEAVFAIAAKDRTSRREAGRGGGKDLPSDAKRSAASTDN